MKKQDVAAEKLQAEAAEATADKPKKTKKKAEAEGSRWAAFILMVLIILAGLFFLIRGELSVGGGYWVIE